MSGRQAVDIFSISDFLRKTFQVVDRVDCSEALLRMTAIGSRWTQRGTRSPSKPLIELITSLFVIVRLSVPVCKQATCSRLWLCAHTN